MNDTKITSMTPEEFEDQDKGIIPTNITGKVFPHILTLASYTSGDNPWTANDVDKFGSKDVTKEYRKTVDSCRFFYRRDALASSVINKLIDIAITDVLLVKGKVSANQFRVFTSLKDDLQDFAEDCALEYLVSGLLIPEFDFAQVTKKELKKRGIKTYESLSLPEALWIRDPETIIINSPLIANKPSYYVEIPEELRSFVKNGGKYADGTEDKELYRELLKFYPKFIEAIKKGETKVKLDNPFVLRRRYLADSPYPTPYLYPSIESLRHKRNLKRMDYSIAARVISAIMQIKVGNDEYPVTDEDDNQLEALRTQMRWRDSSNKDIERIFQLFTNHTVEIDWVYPDTKALLEETKYASVNADILFGLGMPNILITGENEKSQASDASVAMISPEKTMENLRRKIIRVLTAIVGEVAEENNFKDFPEVRLAPMNLRVFTDWLAGLKFLYEGGNISRTTVTEELGYVFEEEAEGRAEEDALIKELGIPEFAPVPFSSEPKNNTEKGDSDESDGET